MPADDRLSPPMISPAPPKDTYAITRTISKWVGDVSPGSANFSVSGNKFLDSPGQRSFRGLISHAAHLRATRPGRSTCRTNRLGPGRRYLPRKKTPSASGSPRFPRSSIIMRFCRTGNTLVPGDLMEIVRYSRLIIRNDTGD